MNISWTDGAGETYHEALVPMLGYIVGVTDAEGIVHDPVELCGTHVSIDEDEVDGHVLYNHILVRKYDEEKGKVYGQPFILEADTILVY